MSHIKHTRNVGEYFNYFTFWEQIFYVI